MKVEKYQKDEQRRILAALITRDDVLGKMHQRLNGERSLFPDRWSNLILRWCLEFYTKYQKAPKGSIEEIFTKYAQTNGDDDATDLIEKFLEGLSSTYVKGKNEDHLVDSASTFFEKIQLKKMTEKLDDFVERGDLEAARELIAGYREIDISTSRWIGLVDPNFLASSVEHKNLDELISFPGALGDFFSRNLCRRQFVAFVGQDKVGKSAWLIEMVWRALKQGRKVLYYVLGDMPEEDIGQRFVCRALRRPLHPWTVKIPKEIINDNRKDPSVKVREEVFEKGISMAEARQCAENLLKKTSSKQSRIQLKREGGSIISASDIERDVKEFIRQGWEPDVVVVDYADELAPEPGTKTLDYRHQVKENWSVLRRVSLNLHCLVITASQTATTGYSTWLLRKSDFSEDKRKNAKVTGMVGINQTNDEYSQGLYRLNWIVIRNKKWSPNRLVWTAGDLSIACPCIISSL